MTVADFRRIALSLEGAEESSHMGSPDFRVGGRIFATLAAEKDGYGNLMLTPEQCGFCCRNARCLHPGQRWMGPDGRNSYLAVPGE